MARRHIHVPLSVFLNSRLVGRLNKHSNGANDFQYDPSWLAWEHALPISLSLPLRGRVRPARLRVRLHGRHDLPAGEPYPLAESAGAAEKRNRSNRHETELFCLRPGAAPSHEASRTCPVPLPIRVVIAL